MEALFLLIPLSLIALGVAIWIFLRMNGSGQFDDTEGPAYSILLDDDDPAADDSAAHRGQDRSRDPRTGGPAR